MPSGLRVEMQVDPVRWSAYLPCPLSRICSQANGRIMQSCRPASPALSRLVPPVLLLALTLAGCRLPLLDGLLTSSADDSPEVLLGGLGDGSAAAGKLETLPLECTFIRHAEEDADLGDTLWNLVDEQCLPTDLRYRLNSNGLRAGMIRGSLPPALAARFRPTADAAATTDGSLLEADQAVVRRVVQALAGRSTEIVATPRVPELVLLERDTRSSAEQLSGQTYADASAIFDVRITPAADGGIGLSLTPLIKHGPIERSWIGDDGAFRLEAGQRKTLMDRLVLELRLPADGILILASAGPPSSSLGDAFFRDPRGRHEGRRLLAVRMLARTTDPMFTAGPAATADD